jgi:hypothetical protein
MRIVVRVVVLSMLAVALVACQRGFQATPCPTGLLQRTATFPDGQSIVQDCPITVTSAADVTAKRQALIQFVWGAGGFPGSKLPSSVDRNIASPVAGLANLGHVDRLNITMDAGQYAFAFHFVPRQWTNNRLVILHQGHGCTFDDSSAPYDDPDGMQRTINTLLTDGYSVLAVYMQHMSYLVPNDCGVPSHDDMFRTLQTTGSVLKFFLEPLVVSLNYLQTRSGADGFPQYREFDMVGLSGGGWETTVYAAIDTRIRLSFPVAGTVPLYMRFNGSEGDTEQNLTGFYQIAHYPDLYVMGAFGAGRKQVQILNRRDSCCFGEAQYDPTLAGMSWEQAVRSYEERARNSLATLGSGSFRVEIDEAAPQHVISWNNVVNVIVAELDGSRASIGAASPSDAFVRGRNGDLWQSAADGWHDTGLATFGAPAAVRDGLHTLDVFYRGVGDNLMHAYPVGSLWTSEQIGGPIIADPVVATATPGQFDVVALTPDYHPSHWWVDGTTVRSEPVGDTLRALGRPAMLSAPGRVDIFVRGFDRALYHARKLGTGPFVVEPLGGWIADFPTAATTSGPSGVTRLVFVRGLDGQIVQVSSLDDAPWQWQLVRAPDATWQFSGAPSASSCSGVVTVQVRTVNDTLATLTRAGTGWTFVNDGGALTDNPVAVCGGVYARDRGGALTFFDGTAWTSRGGSFD